MTIKTKAVPPGYRRELIAKLERLEATIKSLKGNIAHATPPTLIGGNDEMLADEIAEAQRSLPIGTAAS